jgi:D-alanyl-lipoteichoic acid acyltransferase DltB (MBOAT superfamily)
MPYLNLIITMVVGGLWHGANRTFLIWGALHGTGLAVCRLWQVWRKRTATQPGLPLSRLAAGLLTFHFVLFAWIFFRAATVETAWKILSQIASLQNLRFSFDNVTPGFVAVLLAGALGHFIPRNWHDTGVIWFARTPALLQAASLTALVVAIQMVSATGAAPFIYSKF